MLFKQKGARMHFWCFVHLINSFERLLGINKPKIRIRRIKDMLVLIYLALNGSAPSYIGDLLTDMLICRGQGKLAIHAVYTIRYGLHYFQ